jgi:hypothetical protein
MKLLYRKDTGEVIARYQDTPSFLTPQDDQAMIDVPESISVPHAVIRVIPSTEENKPTEFILDHERIQQMWSSVKMVRNQKLRDSDWICSVTDYNVVNKTEWFNYRQQLRDITQQRSPFSLTWPTEPKAMMGIPPAQ